MTDSESASISSLLDGLCHRPVNREGRYTNVELAALVRANGGEITHTYISQLRKGDKDNPTSRTIEDLAAALGVHPAYFLGGRCDRLPGEPAQWRRDGLRHLFATVHPSGRGPYTPEEVALAIGRDGRYGAISASYIRELLAGTSEKPRLKHILGLARHFGAPAAYFFDVVLAARIDAQLETHRVMENLGVNQVIMRAAEELPSLEVRRKVLVALARALRPEVSSDEAVEQALRSGAAEPGGHRT
ncbi:helix-turn-helix domain-containing protein [Amycolatopsis sp. NPDC049868]|uniref:helix-turn-helix domain-containing protein n=1 Tax=Amycolatopsis sp. NPDC049868 TaxID=3363934 RepID=UPI0037A70914